MAGKEILNPSVKVSTILGRNPSGNLQEASVDVTGALITTSSGGGGGTVNQGNPNSVANGWPMVITDLTDILGTSAHPLRIDPTGTTVQPVSGTVSTGGLTDTQLRATAVPVSGPLTDTQLRATAVPVSGSVTVSGTVAFSNASIGVTQGTSPWVISGAVTATLAAETTKVIGTINQGTSPWITSGAVTVSGGDWLTDTQLRAIAVPISGSITANAGSNLNTSALALDTTLIGGTQKTKIVDTGGTNVASVSATGAVSVDGSAVTQPVSGTFFQTTQPVSGPLTDTQLRASSVPIDYAITTVALLEKLLEEIQAMRAMLTHVVCESGEAFPGDFSVYLNGFNDSQTVIE